jgi:hypothetical protein
LPETDQEILKNFQYEMGLNLGIVRPSPGTRDCSSEFRVDYFRNNQDKLSKLPVGLADRLRAIYGKMEEENRYIRILLEVGYDRFRFDHWNEFAKWGQLCDDLLAGIQQLNVELESLTRETPSAPLEIFISYSTKDKAIAAKVANSIRLAGGEGFLAHETIEVSMEWRSEILRHLRACSVIFCLITKNFLDSEWTQQEAGFALAREMKVVSLLFNGISPPGFMEAFQGIHVTVSNLDRIIKELVESIKTNLAAASKLEGESLTRKPDEPAVVFTTRTTEAISDLGWQILDAAKGNSGEVIATMEIARAIRQDNALVYEECIILRDDGYLHFTDDSHGMALLKITGPGLQALRNRPKHS